MRLLGELAAKAGATDLPLHHGQSMRIRRGPDHGYFAYLTSSTLTQAGLAVRKLYGR